MFHIKYVTIHVYSIKECITLMRKRKTYEELTFSDDFMFCNILSNHLDLCKELLELLLDVKIRKIEIAQTQKVIDVTYEGKGVRFDVYVEDDMNSVYDIEMQTVTKKDLPKRSRYYQGMIDSNLINKGQGYTKLKKSYIIFICMDVDELFAGNLPVYTFENTCLQDSSIKLDDEAIKVIINANGNRESLSENMGAFLDFIKDNVANSHFTKKIQEVISDSKSKSKWRDVYMTLEMKIQEEREEAHEEGLAEGRAEGLLSTIKLCKKIGWDYSDTVKQVMEDYNLDEETAQVNVSALW